MNVRNRLPRRLVWAAILFLLTGVGTASAGTEDFIREVVPALIGETVGDPAMGAFLSLIVSVSLGILYFRAGYGLLRRQERWRRRATYLAAALSVLMGLSLVLVVGAYLADAQGAAQRATWVWFDQEVAPQSTRGMLVAAAAAAATGGPTAAFGWAYSVLQRPPTHKTFAREEDAAREDAT